MGLALFPFPYNFLELHHSDIVPGSGAAGIVRLRVLPYRRISRYLGAVTFALCRR